MIAVVELAHVQLAGSSGLFGAMRLPVDHDTTSSADAFAAVAFKLDGYFAFGDQVFVNNVEHFQEGHVFGDVVGLVLDETAFGVGTSLAPDFEGDVDC